METYKCKPYIPNDKVNMVLVDYRIDSEIERNLLNMEINIVKTIKCNDLYEAVNGHPDMLIHHLGDNELIVAPNIYKLMEPVLTKKGFAVTKGTTWLIRNYPFNIAYNVLRLGNKVFHNTKYTDRLLLKKLEEQGLEIIHVNQGYAKCSVCIINENAIITSDLMIARAAERKGIEVLLIKPGGIILKGLNYGFIGGASGLVSSDTLAFTGTLNYLEDKNKILDFLSYKGINVKILSSKQIIDFGSIIPIKC